MNPIRQTPRRAAHWLEVADHGLAARLAAVRATTLALAEPLSAEDCAIQSMPDASPVKWHLAHTSWFFETFVLAPHLRDYAVFDERFRVLFNSYYNGVGDKHPRPERGLLSRPSLDTVKAYRRHVDGALQQLFAIGPLDKSLADLIELGLNHEQQHQELIVTDLKHLLSRNPLAPVYRETWPLAPVASGQRGWVRQGGGLVTMGHDGKGFAFDNEGPAHRTWLEPFELATHPVSNSAYADFIDDGGYRRPELWLSAGWDSVQLRGWEAPAYWSRSGAGDRWHAFTLHGQVPVDPNTPVCHVSFYEAEAFARWAGARLPSEAEWETAARCQAGAADVADTANPEANFLDRGVFHPVPARTAAVPGRLDQLFGDVWEWTRSDYAPYPGFNVAEGAIGEYNGKFMCGQFVLRGGSCATPRSHIRRTYRNFFPPDARWQFSGIRLARSVAA